MIPYREQAPQMVSAMSPRPGALGGPPVMHQPQAGPPGIGMGRGASNTGLQSSALSANNPGHPGQHFMHEESSEAQNNEIQLNSYIYDHLLKNGFYQAARGLLNETNLQLVDGPRDDSADQDGDGHTLLPRRSTNLKRSQSGMDHPNSSPNNKPNGKSPRSGSNSPNSGHADLPPANVPLKAPGGFLREWWGVFWDIYAARSGRTASSFAQAYLETQRNQQRGPQYQAQFNPAMQRAQMMNGVAEEANSEKAKQNLMHTAMINNGRKVTRPGQPGPMQMQQGQPQNQAQLMALHSQAAQRQAQAQQQARDNEDPNSSSPAMGNANSPNKRQRLTPPNDQGQVPSQMPNQGQPANGGQQLNFPNPVAAANFLKQSGVELPPNMGNQDIMNIARQLAQQTNPGKMHIQQVNSYKQNLAMQQSQQGLTAARNSIGAGGLSPAGQPAQIPFVNPGIPGGNPFGGRDGAAQRAPTQEELAQLANQAKAMGGTLQHPSQGGSHSLQDYQNQLMVLELQNKKRLQHARQETNNRSDDPGNGPMNGQFPQQAGQGLQPGRQMQGTSMSPSNSRTGPSPQIANLELQRKAGQKPGSGGASPESGEPVGPNRGPSPAFSGQAGGMSTEQYAQMTGQMGGAPYGQPVMMNGQPFMAGRPHPNMQLGQQQNQLGYEMMVKQGAIPRPQAGQPYPQGWQPVMNQPMAQQMRQGMVPGQTGPHGPNPQQQMPPPPQPQPQAARQTTAPSESPSLANAQPPTPTPGNKPPPKAKNAKEGGRAKRNRSKGAAAPATPNPSEPHTPTTPITPLPTFNNNQSQSQSSQPQQQQQQPQPQQQPSEQPAQPAQDAPPSAFSAIDGADATSDPWANPIDDKWMTMPMDFASTFNNSLDGFPGSTFATVNMDEDPMVNYSEFLNDNDGLTMDLGLWTDDINGTEA